jgi:hypothetical protein
LVRFNFQKLWWKFIRTLISEFVAGEFICHVGVAISICYTLMNVRFLCKAHNQRRKIHLYLYIILWWLFFVEILFYDLIYILCFFRKRYRNQFKYMFWQIYIPFFLTTYIPILNQLYITFIKKLIVVYFYITKKTIFVHLFLKPNFVLTVHFFYFVKWKFTFNRKLCSERHNPKFT